MKPDPKKIDSVRNFSTPRNQKQIRQFNGLCNFYRRFIPDIASLLRLLTHLLRDRVPFKWSVEQEEFFAKLEKILTSAPILQHPDFSLRFFVTSDASNFAIGGVFSQRHGDADLPVAFPSRVLTATEVNYSTIEKELLAMIYCAERFEYCIYGRQFTFTVDHQPLVWLVSVKNSTSRLERWQFQLEEVYDFTVEYRPGKSKYVADALSRNPPVEAPKAETVMVLRKRGDDSLSLSNNSFDQTQKRSRLDSDDEPVYRKGEFLAVSNENKDFFLCQALKDIFDSEVLVKIRWLLRSSESGNKYINDYNDKISFESILTDKLQT